MTYAVLSLNYLAVLVVAIAGFLIGWLWYSPLLFAKPWLEGMKMTEESMQESMKNGMAPYLIKSFLFTLLSTFGLAVLIQAHAPANWMKSAVYGAFVGLAVVGGRLLNGSVWENRPLKLQAINLGHELVLFAVQGAILGLWR